MKINKYDLDPQYYEIKTDSYDQVRSVVPSGNISFDYNNPELMLDTDMINAVADRLVRMCNYICNLRERLKLQTRKNYLRGTNNLLVYLINEYLRNYPYSESLTDSTSTEAMDAMSRHSLNDIDIIEYYDPTEYYNLST